MKLKHRNKMKKKLLFNLLLALVLIVNSSMVITLGKQDWDYNATCGGFSDKDIPIVIVTGTFKYQKELDIYLKKCAVHAVIFRGLTPSASNMCSTQPPICAGMTAYEDKEKFYDAFFKDDGEYASFVTVVDAKRGTEMKEKGKGYVKTMHIAVNRATLKKYIESNK
jgi:hypothetical protein